MPFGKQRNKASLQTRRGYEVSKRLPRQRSWVVVALPSSFIIHLIRFSQLHQKRCVCWYEIVMIDEQTCPKSNSVVMTFFLMMVLFPDAQKKVQAQIDAVIGKGRIPRLQDRPSLPFIDALLRETMRYNPVAPLCKSRTCRVAFCFSSPSGAFLLN